MSDTPPPAATASGGLTERLATDLLTLDAELSEVDLLVTQAKAEAIRHESRRSTASDKLAAMPTEGDPKDRLDLAGSLITLTKRAALMESQVDVLEGKRRALARYRDAVAEYLAGADGVPFTPRAAIAAGAGASGRPRMARSPASTPMARSSSRRPSRAWCCRPRRTCAARSPGRCTTGPPRA